MTRYLTPDKVSLLVLCSLYCSSAVPTSSTVVFLSFIINCLKLTSISIFGEELSSDIVPGPAESLRRTEIILEKHASSVPGRTLFDLFLARLWTIDSLDALHRFFAGLDNLLASSSSNARQKAGNDGASSPPHVLLARVSPLGVFVRRCHIEFTRLQFHDTMRLWMALVRYKELTVPAQRRKGRAVSTQQFDISLEDFEGEQRLRIHGMAYAHSAKESGNGMIQSSSDLERLLEFQVDKLQKLGNRVPSQMMDQLRDILLSAPYTPSLAYFVRFFEAWRVGDYTSAFDYLHRYFDYTMQARDKTYYQYALLHMAILHADFGCYEEAMSSMLETIATARENQDINCLNFSLSWLSHLGKAHPGQMSIKSSSLFGSEKQALAFLKTKAKDGKMWSLLSSVLLNETKLELSKGGNIVKVFELVYQSAHLNAMHNLDSNHGVSLLMNSSIISRLGMHYVSVTYLHLLVHSGRTASPMEDKVRALCRLAYTTSQRGSYNEALQTLSSAGVEVHRIMKIHQGILSHMGSIKLVQYLRRAETTPAKHLLKALTDTAITDPELYFALRVLSLEQLAHTGSQVTALVETEKLLARVCRQGSDIYYITSAQLLRMRLLYQCGEGHRGLSLAMRAATTAYRARLIPLLLESLSMIAVVMLDANEFVAAQRLLQAMIPQAIEGSDAMLCATLYSLEADTWVGIAGLCNHTYPNHTRQKAVIRAHCALDKALDYYDQCQDRRGQADARARKSMLALAVGEGQMAEREMMTYIAERSFHIERIGET